MPFDDLSKDELVFILELIELSRKCSSQESLRDILLKARKLFEAEFAVCGVTEVGLPVITGYVNGTYPQEWVNRYKDGNLNLCDPIIRFQSKYAMTQIWTDVFRQYEDPGARKLVKDASDYGLKFGISGAIYVPEAEKVAIFTFADAQDRFTKRHKRILDILTMHLNGALLRSVDIVGKKAAPSLGGPGKSGGGDGLQGIL